MSVLFADTMTVYNYHKNRDTGEETWKRTVVKGIQWRHNKAELNTANGVQTESRVESITIDFERGYGNKPYMPPNEYRKLPNDKQEGYWTLDAKSGHDVLVQGICENEVTKDYRISALKEDFQYVVTVTAVSDNRNRPRLKHIKVVGK